MGVGCKEYPASVKFIIHNFSIHAHHCAVNNTITIQPVDGIDGEEHIVRTSPTGTKQKPSKSLVRTLRRFSFIVSGGYQHHRIPDVLSDVRRKMSPKVLNAPMPEVWTHDNLSRHFMPRSNTVFQLFILLCSIVSLCFYIQ